MESIRGMEIRKFSRKINFPSHVGKMNYLTISGEDKWNMKALQIPGPSVAPLE